MLIARSRRAIDGLRHFARQTAGLAVIEFAMCAPVLVILVCGGLECANLVFAHMRMSRIASMTADNASRVRDSIDEADIVELMTGANLAGGNYNLKSQGRVIVSALQKNDAGNGQWIRWQRCYGDLAGGSTYGLEGKGKNDNSLQAMGPTGRQIVAADGTTVMFVEARYAYQPLLGLPWGTARTIAYTSAYNVRKRPNADPTDASGLRAANKAATC